MIRARYNGDKQDFVAFGISFPPGQFVDVTDAKIAAKLKGNSHYTVDQGEFEDVVFTEVPAAPKEAQDQHESAEKPRRGRKSKN